MESGLVIPNLNTTSIPITRVSPTAKDEIKYTSPNLETSKSIFNPSTSPPVNSFMSRLQGRNILYQRK